MSSIPRFVRRALAPTALCLMGTAAYAQDASEPDTVLITGQKQPYRGDTPLKELPQSVQVLSADLLQDVGVTRLETALDLATGVARQNSFGGLWDSFAIRGFAGDENLPSGYLVNGFNAGRGFSGRRDSSNIESIEVLKGPGSALYGRSEPGGTVNLITKKPKFEPQGSVELSAGRFETYRASADYTGPITDSIAFRVNGAYDDAQSFRDTVESKKYTVSPSVLLKLSSSTTLSYELEYVHQEAPFDRGIVAPGAVLGVVPNSRFLGEPNDGPMTIKSTGHQLVLQQNLAGDWSLLVGAGYRDSSFEGFSSEAELAASRQTLGRAATPTLLSRQRRFRDYDATDQSARAELTGRFETGFLTHHVLLGTDWYHYKLDLLQNRFRPSLAVPYGIDILNPVYGQAAPTPLPFTSSLEQQHAEGFYVQDQIDLTAQWKMLAGVRYDRFRQELADRITNKTSRQSPTATSPRVGLVYQVVPSTSVYASFSKGFRPNSGQDISGTAFVPEKSRSYEIGTKFDLLDGKINSTLALYKSHKSNILTSDPINAGFSIAAGEAESKGVELDASGKITEDLRATVSYAYTDAKVTKASLDVNFGNLLPVGARLINIPKNSASLLLIQDFHVNTSVIGLGGGVNYVSQRLGETGVPDFQLPSYVLVRLMGYYQPTEHLKFSVDVDNLFDRTYYPSSYARYWVGAGAPRSYSARAEYRF